MSEQDTHHDEPATYDVRAVQDKWLPVWDELQPFRADDESPREKKYALTMFPYPSGDLHMGHAEVTALHDVIARYWWQRGFEVLNPMGWDSFGLPAENAAIRNNEHPATYTYANIETQYESFKRYGISFDWSRRLHTSDPEYYRWTQWLFLKFRERGLAYRKNSPVNWCPNDQTVLANEQVVDGRCERCGAEVTKRELTQWYFKITEYAQELLDELDNLEATWPSRVVTAQRNWIGRSEGAHVSFAVEGRDEPSPSTRPAPTPCSARRSWSSPPTPRLAAELVTDAQRPAYEAYREEIRKATEIDRLSTDRPKTGVDLGVDGDEPGHRRPDPGVGDRLRAGRLRHRRGHGRARRRPARLGVRDRVRPADRPDDADAGRLRGRGVPRRGSRDQLTGSGRRERAGPQRPAGRRGQAGDDRAPASRSGPARARSTSGCATGC